jgi:ribokinase
VEAAGITGASGATAASRLRAGGAGCAIVTMGASGCVFTEGREIASLPAIAAVSVDSTGAGDTFCGMLAACRAAGLAWPEAIAAAQRAAAVAVTRPGAYAALPSAAELRAIAAP